MISNTVTLLWILSTSECLPVCNLLMSHKEQSRHSCISSNMLLRNSTQHTFALCYLKNNGGFFSFQYFMTKDIRRDNYLPYVRFLISDVFFFYYICIYIYFLVLMWFFWWKWNNGRNRKANYYKWLQILIEVLSQCGCGCVVSALDFHAVDPGLIPGLNTWLVGIPG